MFARKHTIRLSKHGQPASNKHIVKQCFAFVFAAASGGSCFPDLDLWQRFICEQVHHLSDWII